MRREASSIATVVSGIDFHRQQCDESGPLSLRESLRIDDAERRTTNEPILFSPRVVALDDP
jgi:hypothetical protein